MSMFSCRIYEGFRCCSLGNYNKHHTEAEREYSQSREPKSGNCAQSVGQRWKRRRNNSDKPHFLAGNSPSVVLKAHYNSEWTPTISKDEEVKFSRTALGLSRHTRVVSRSEFGSSLWELRLWCQQKSVSSRKWWRCPVLRCHGCDVKLRVMYRPRVVTFYNYNWS